MTGIDQARVGLGPAGVYGLCQVMREGSLRVVHMQGVSL